MMDKNIMVLIHNTLGSITNKEKRKELAVLEQIVSCAEED